MLVDPPAPVMPVGLGQHPHIGAIELGSRAPGRAAAWYRQALGLSGRGEVVNVGDVELRFVSRVDVAPATVEPIRVVLNFHVADIRAIEARLVAMQVAWVRELEDTPFGIIGTVVDFDGNYVQIIESARGSVPWCAKGREKQSP
jgi:predicted enzyme related to lactoylglutathione lyase